MKYKVSQMFMLWLLPVILLGGIFFPLLGYLVVAMMAALLVISVFKPRYWCGHYCPRGAFLDIFLSRVSRGRALPVIFMRQWFRWLVLAAMFLFLSWRLLSVGAQPAAIGAVFVVMCILTTLIAVVLGIIYKHRAWCMICPMGKLQEQAGKICKKRV